MRTSLECVSHKKIGLFLGTSIFFGYLIGLLIAPRLADLHGSRIFVLAGHVIQLPVYIAFRHIRAIEVFSIAYVMVGIGLAGSVQLQYIYMIEMIPK